MRKKFIFFCLLFMLKVYSHADLCSTDTYAIIIGVLEWQDELASFPAANRKDAELCELLISKGIPRENISLLIDKQATLKNIESELTWIARRTQKGSKFIFYYAGHGLMRSGDIYLVNYDINCDDAAGSGLSVDTIGNLLNANFKGETIFILADCCYSGGLKNTALNLARKGFKTASITSADSSNSSTENWTFTQTIIDCFSGNPLADRDFNGRITLDEVCAEVVDAMKYRESQKSGILLKGLAGSFIITQKKWPVNRPSAEGAFAPGDYAKTTGNADIVRILDFENNKALCEYYSYSEKEEYWLPLADLAEITFKVYPVGSRINILYDEELYPGSILKIDNDFHLVSYDDWDSCWDEWVLDNRIVTDDIEVVHVKWNGKWYPATILKTGGNRYYIHYLDYNSSWDEWVTKDRIRF